MDPFLAARNIRPEYNPVATPGPHKQQFLKNVMFWLMLEPLIRSGRVVVFPDPGDMSPEFERAMREMALERTANWHPKSEKYIEFRGFARQDMQRSLLMLPDKVLLSMFKRTTPDQSDEFVQRVIDYMRREGARDPLALLQVVPEGDLLHQTLALRSVNLEVAVFMAQALGAVIVTNIGALWEHLHLHTRASAAAGETPPTEGAPMQGALNPFDSLQVAAWVSAEEARSAIRTLRTAAEARQDTAGPLAALSARLAALMTGGTLEHHPDATVDLTVIPSMPPGGFESSTAQRLVVGFGRGDPPVLLSLALFFKADWGNEDSGDDEEEADQGDLGP
jgi:hypothetical protein